MAGIWDTIVRSFRRFRKSPAFTGFILFVAVLILNIIVQSPAKFFTFKNINTLFAKNVPFILVTMGQAVLLIGGVLDISNGIQLALVNVVSIMTFQELGFPMFWGFVAGLGAGILISVACGLCVSVLRLPAMLASYAMTFIIKGINVLIMSVPQGAVPKDYYLTYDSLLGGFLPVSLLFLVAAFAIWGIARRTRFGKHLYAVGGNPRNAFAAGINPVRTQMTAFVIKGIFTGLAGIALTLMTASGNPLQAEEYGIRSLSACIIGGLGFGGWGSVACGAFGAGFMVIIQNAVYYLFTLFSKWIPGFQVSSYWQNFVSDIIVFVGLLMTIVTAKAQREALKQGLVKQFKRGEEYVK